MANDLAEAVGRFADAVSAPRRWREEPCAKCKRPAGEVCNLDRHVLIEIGDSEYVLIFGEGGLRE